MIHVRRFNLNEEQTNAAGVVFHFFSSPSLIPNLKLPNSTLHGSVEVLEQPNPTEVQSPLDPHSLGSPDRRVLQKSTNCFASMEVR